VTSPTTQPAESMYTRIGGAPTVRRVVDRMYAWILRDDVLYLRYFDGVDMAPLKAHMVALLSQLLGGAQVLHRPGYPRRARPAGHVGWCADPWL
jgi:hemoglobin